jgi:hypothetical protein
MLLLAPTGWGSPEIWKAPFIATYLSLGLMISTSRFTIHGGRFDAVGVESWGLKGSKLFFF